MKILWFTWKDRQHPQAGGAETVNEELAKRLARDGHEVVFIVAGFLGCAPEETRDGFKVIRLGGRYTVYWKAYRYYTKHLRGWADLVIEEINTVPFFTKLYTRGERTIYIFYQLCREIWFYQLGFPVNIIGYISEPLYLRYLAKTRCVTLTESESAKQDLIKYGFDSRLVHIFSVGLEIDRLSSFEGMEKYTEPTMLSLGAIREMKRTDDQIKAFELAKRDIPALKLKIAGSGSGKYFHDVQKMIQLSEYAGDIEYLGKISLRKKITLIRKCHCIVVTSVKEGWGLIVTEANSQGTPAVAYDVDGLRDSVRNNETGILSINNTPESLALAIAFLFHNTDTYEKLRVAGWQWSADITFENGYVQFAEHITS
jgi:glycosyltransferase involved in cell wall biosynthesis